LFGSYSLSTSAAFIVGTKAAAKKTYPFTILDKYILTTIDFAIGDIPVNVDPYVQIDGKFKWSVSATVSAGYKIPTQSWTRGVQYVDDQP
jgi:hypothetical protein